ncbi:DUF485 domain-containing protein [Streptomyces sp. NPDC014734]|uniref:DUF485 domain-containing protein n=1 Tax=Streptomyces sp. NPDC014734 TaxID=3364886 RepID=UPI003701F1EC
MSHGNPPPPSPYASWPGQQHQPPQPPHESPHRPRPQSPPPQHADYLLPWQRSRPATFPDPPHDHGAPRAAPAAAAVRHGDLRRLRTSYRQLRRVAVLTALGWFVVFLLLSGFAGDQLERPLFGGLNLGLALAFCQLPVTLLAVVRYERTARRTVDPLAARIRKEAADQ